MATLPNLGIVEPVLGGDNGTWDDRLNAALQLIDAHDHTSGKGLRIRTDALNIDEDLTFAGFGATNVGRVGFTAVAALSTGARALYVDTADNELYWRTNAGVNVKLTSGTSINTTLVGGIVGDYTAVNAEVAYEDANDRYTFKQQGSPKPWARVMCGGLQLAEFNTNESLFVRLIAPAALASSYDVTWPTAPPAATAIVQMSSAGVLSASNTVVELDVANASTFNDDVTVSGEIHGESTLVVDGKASLLGAHAHGDRVLNISPAAIVAISGGNSFNFAPARTVLSAGGTMSCAIPLKEGDRIKSVTFARFGDGVVDITAGNVVSTSASGVDTNLATSLTVTNVAAAWTDSTITVTTPTALAAGAVLTLFVTGNAANLAVGAIRVTYDRP